MTQKGEQVSLQVANLQYLIEEAERRARREGQSAAPEGQHPTRVRHASPKPAGKR